MKQDRVTVPGSRLAEIRQEFQLRTDAHELELARVILRARWGSITNEPKTEKSTLRSADGRHRGR